jgi:hypothetical protein
MPNCLLAMQRIPCLCQPFGNSCARFFSSSAVIIHKNLSYIGSSLAPRRGLITSVISADFPRRSSLMKTRQSAFIEP